MAAFGFWVLDVGENRLLASKGAVLEGPYIDRVTAEFQALTIGLDWLVREGLNRRKIVAYTDSPDVFQSTGGIDRGIQAYPNAPAGVRETFAQFPQLAIKLIDRSQNKKSVDLALQAYVSAQETERMLRVPEVLPELTRIGPYEFLVGDRYKVNIQDGTCTCPDFRRTHNDEYPIRCKHLLAAIKVQSEQE